MRLFPADDLGEVSEAVITLKDGRVARVTMHLIEGNKEQIEETLQQSVEAFFERPCALRARHPKLYEQLRNYFQQEPVEYSAETIDR